MICDLPNWWSFLTYYGFNYHANFTDALKNNQRIVSRLVIRRLVQALSIKCIIIPVYSRQQSNKADPGLARRKVHGQINQWKLIIIIFIATQNIPVKVWTDFFVAVNLHPHHQLYFSEWIKKIVSYVKMVETAYFCNHECYYYGSMPSVWKKAMVIKRIEVMYAIDCFTAETTHVKSPWTAEIPTW